MAKRRRRRLGPVAAVAVAAAGAVAYGVWSGQKRWLVDDDPCGPEGLTLPEGDAFTVTTDDGATLDGLVAGPSGAPTVALPHCWGGIRDLWGAVARRLVASGHRVVLYDQRGHGGSTMGRDAVTVDRLGSDLRAVLEHLDVRDVVLAGHSMGGMTIQAFAIAHPEAFAARVRAIVLVATSSNVMPRALAAGIADRAVGDAMLRPWSKNAVGLAFTRRALGDKAHRSHIVATRDAFFGTAGATRAACLVGMSAMDLRAGLETITVPATVVVGTQDRLTPPRMARVLAERIPQAELVVLQGAGHMLPLEEPDAVAEAIAARTTIGKVADPVG
jgi:pimeloyl-ACP methyl ester carboxylesterase